MLLAGPGASDQQSTIVQLERDVPELMKNSNVPGVSIALIQRGKTIWVHGFGVKKAGTSQPVTGETVFEAASLSKPVFAYGALKLVDVASGRASDIGINITSGGTGKNELSANATAPISQSAYGLCAESMHQS
jgi:hypothetical protein